MSVAVLGAGAGGAATAAELIGKGHKVTLWSRSKTTIGPIKDAGGMAFDGALGEGTAVPDHMTDDLEIALDGAEVVVACLPAIAHDALAHALADLSVEVPIVLNPGGTGGALLFRAAFGELGAGVPALAELSTLTSIARMVGPARVSIFALAESVHGACLPGGEPALDAAESLFGRIRRDPHVLSTSLRNVNLVLHPPVALLSAAWVEATDGDFFFYSEAVTPGVARVMEAFDAERRAVGSAIGLQLPGLIEEMAAVGSIDRGSFERGLFREAIARGEANRSIKAPSSLRHRYYEEDLACAVLPFSEFARIWDVPTPVADAILTLGSALLGFDVRSAGLTSGRLGIAGMGADDLLNVVGGS